MTKQQLKQFELAAKRAAKLKPTTNHKYTLILGRYA